MSYHIPFVNSKSDIDIACTVFKDSEFFRVAPSQASALRAKLPGARLWVDARVDGLHHYSKANDEEWKKEVGKFGGAEAIANLAQGSGVLDKNLVKKFVEAALNACYHSEPEWVSVPQIPIHQEINRNKLNKAMAKAAGEWKIGTKATCKMMLPIILTHQSLVNQKTDRNGHIKAAAVNYSEAKAEGAWTVEASLSDQDGANTFPTKRFPGLVAFHEELVEALGDSAVHVGGPYWAMNLVLWARGAIDYPGIGLGSAFQYFVPGVTPSAGKVRVVVEAIRRCAVVSGLREWIPKALKAKGLPQPASQSLRDLHDAIVKGLDKIPARQRTASFYKQWIDKIAANHPDGRAVALYQDLSAAFVAGSAMPVLDEAEGPATREPAKVARQLMMSCL
jgi:hypothetical protein